MIYFILFFVLIMSIEGIGGSKLFDNEKKIKYSHVFLFLVMWIFFGLREKTILVDSITYVTDFQDKYYSIGHSISWYFDEYKEPLLPMLTRLVRIFTDNYTVYFFVTSLLFCLGISLIFKEESEDYLLSTILLVTLGILTFSFAGIRQSIAMGICYISYLAVKKRRLILFLILILIAFLFHKSAIAFIVAYPLYKVKAHPAMLIVVAIFFLLSEIKSDIINKIGEMLTSEENYIKYFEKEEEESLNYTMFAIQVAMTIFCFFYRKEICEKYESGNFMFTMAIIGLCAQTLSSMFAVFFRLSMYFSVFLCVLVTKAISVEKNNNTKWAEFFLIIIVCVFYMFVLSKITNTYIPFWSTE